MTSLAALNKKVEKITKEEASPPSSDDSNKSDSDYPNVNNFPNPSKYDVNSHIEIRVCTAYSCANLERKNHKDRQILPRTVEGILKESSNMGS